MGYYRGQSSAMLLDSQRHGAEAELLLVEGESAAQSVAAVRQSLRQAVPKCMLRAVIRFRRRMISLRHW